MMPEDQMELSFPGDGPTSHLANSATWIRSLKRESSLLIQWGSAMALVLFVSKAESRSDKSEPLSCFWRQSNFIC
jgi:hypothetical protein